MTLLQLGAVLPELGYLEGHLERTPNCPPLLVRLALAVRRAISCAFSDVKHHRNLRKRVRFLNLECASLADYWLRRARETTGCVGR